MPVLMHVIAKPLQIRLPQQSPYYLPLHRIRYLPRHHAVLSSVHQPPDLRRKDAWQCRSAGSPVRTRQFAGSEICKSAYRDLPLCSEFDVGCCTGIIRVLKPRDILRGEDFEFVSRAHPRTAETGKK